jgi:transposase
MNSKDPNNIVNHVINLMSPHLNEKDLRLLAASCADALGFGGISLVSNISNLSRVTITKGIREIYDTPLENRRIRSEGGGRPHLKVKEPDLISNLLSILAGNTRGDPESPLLWTFMSTYAIADHLNELGFQISHDTVGTLLKELGYSLQANKKTVEGNQHVDRNKQFIFINNKIAMFLNEDLPVLSVDTKKKELVGNYKNPGAVWLPQGNPKLVKGHDFPDPSVPKASPYGAYDVGQNTGFVNVGTDHDTASFAVASIRGWWKNVGSIVYNKVDNLLITADGGGSNGYRTRLWKLELQNLADELEASIHVCHFPPVTSKWNAIEHRLFSFISSNWRGKPLVDYETIVKLISNTKTATGLKVVCVLDNNKYPTGRKGTDKEMKYVNITRDNFHGEWNYVIKSNKNCKR